MPVQTVSHPAPPAFSSRQALRACHPHPGGGLVSARCARRVFVNIARSALPGLPPGGRWQAHAMRLTEGECGGSDGHKSRPCVPVPTISHPAAASPVSRGSVSSISRQSSWDNSPEFVGQPGSVSSILRAARGEGARHLGSQTPSHPALSHPRAARKTWGREGEKPSLTPRRR
jgi:hypothetical protein